MHELTKLIKDDMKPALGVTEPGAIAYAVSTACSYLNNPVDKIELSLNSGIYKNAFTCGIPNSSHLGNYYSAALGAIAADPKLCLECLSPVTPEDNRKAEEMIEAGKVIVTMSEVSSRIHIEATAYSGEEDAKAVIWDGHTNITCIEHNGKVIKGSNEPPTAIDSDLDSALIHKYSLKEIFEYIRTVPLGEIEFIKEAYDTNLHLLDVGLASERTIFAHQLLKRNGGVLISNDELASASLLCNGAIEARVLGLDAPAMSITGSGAHGIIATLPIYAVCKINGYTNESLYRATALSYLICMYIKEYSGKLSAFCGCAIAAGTGMAVAITYLGGGDYEALCRAINNMSSSITGMICDGGNHGCTMKGIVAVDAAFRSRDLALAGAYIGDEHGINGHSPEDTMHHMGLVASPGMVKTEGTIVDIMQNKGL